ncbi:DNA cytosine methyltransferase [Candidatus Phytoplasma solani]|uniref:DNA cytosine methyltransferase n=1 Tax=Candidatus Phytoplasma solani TaxID=69896 RepID=UPI00358F69BC
MINKKIKLATVFSGIGAIEQAFMKQKIDHEIIFACDNGEITLKQTYQELQEEFYRQNKYNIDEFIKLKYRQTNKINYVKRSYLMNYDPKNWHEDIRFLNGQKYRNKVDILVAGSPCQSFSIIGKQKGLDDIRGNLFYDFVRLVKEIQPKVFIFENVPGIVTHNSGYTFNKIKEAFSSINYNFKYEILNSIDFGIPQNRKRMFFVGFKDPSYDFLFPQKQKLTKTTFDYLEKEVNAKHYLGKKGFEFVSNTGNKKRTRTKINSKIIKTQTANQQFNWIGDFIFEKFDKVKNNKEIIKRAYIGEYLGEKGVIRQLSHRECLRLMGFSDEFKINVPNIQIYRQAGNSIVVNVLEALLESIIKTGIFYHIQKLKVATVFSGIGAFEFALKKTNIKHEIIFACDNGNRNIEYNSQKELQRIKAFDSIDEKVNYVNKLYETKTKKKNYVQLSYEINYDISKDRFFQDVKLLDGKCFENKIDILVGGTPCQSFSIVGLQKGFEDERGMLFFEYARIIGETKPKVFIFENVKSLLTSNKGQDFNKIEKTITNLGYKYYYKLLKAQDYGIPQNRTRLFVVGFKNNNVKFNFPQPVDLKFKMQDFLQENCKKGHFVYKDGNLTINNIGEQVDDKYFLTSKIYNYVMSTGTKSFVSKPITDLPIARPILSTMGNRHRAGIDNYVTVKNKVRMLTEREAHRLMGFSDDYKIVVSRTQAYKQAGNSICVPILISLIQTIIKLI